MPRRSRVKSWLMLFTGIDYPNAPASDEIELALLGPGFGEAVCIHVGDGKWVLIDSCVISGVEGPAPLQYLQDLGASGADVCALIASHWDDDHIRGFADLMKACVNALPVMSLAFGQKDFLAYVEAHSQPLTTKARGGVREIRETFQVLEESQRTSLKGAMEAKQIFNTSAFTFSHGQDFELWTLSPSTEEFENFLTWIGSCMPQVRETRRVAISQKRNDLSVVAHVRVGDIAVLAGGDLERRGWGALLANVAGPTTKASAYKIAHHGGASGDAPGIWSQLLEADPVAVLAPWRLGGGDLPTKSDASRILANAKSSFSTATVPDKAAKHRPAAVKRQLRLMGVNPRSVASEPGMIRLRRKLGSPTWNVELFGGAVALGAAHVPV